MTATPPSRPVPTSGTPVGTDQLIDNVNRPDRPDRPDWVAEGSGGKQKSLAGLVEKIRQRRKETDKKSCEEHRLLNSDFVSHPAVSQECGTVGTVGTPKENSGLGPDRRSGRGSGRSGHPPAGMPDFTRPSPRSVNAGPPGWLDDVPIADGADVLAGDWTATVGNSPMVDAWGMTNEEKAAGLTRLREAGRSVQAERLPDCRYGSDIRGDAIVWAAGVAQLGRMAPLRGFSDARWATLQTDAAAILTKWGEQLRRLEWSAVDVFGVSPIAPWNAIHCRGLAILLDGSAVAAMTAEGATIRRRGSISHTFVRRERFGVVPIWNLFSHDRDLRP